LAHESELIGTVAMGLTAAFVIGLICAKIRIPPIVGYLVAGMVIGPFTPGYVADASIATQLAELGVILLLFGVGLHFSLSDLMAVRHVAVPGALLRILAGTAMGLVTALAWGWSVGAGLIFGIGLSVASTVVLLRALIDLGSLNQTRSKIAVGWLIVEDLLTVIVLVLMPVLSEQLGGIPVHDASGSVVEAVAFSVGKVVIFLVVMLVIGRRVLPWIFKGVAGVDSREIFMLAVLASALGVAYGAARLFDVSLALGAFVAGVVLSETAFGHQAEEEIYTIREAFSVLFFVSVGMLIDPSFLIENPWRIAVVTFIIVVGKSVAAYVITVMLGQTSRTALTVAVGLGQVGEFSFILATAAVELQILPKMGSDLILAGALVSITLNAILFRYLDRIQIWLDRHVRWGQQPQPLAEG
jgi:CPA2 family monovalent cation:H+ antiporter-2